MKRKHTPGCYCCCDCVDDCGCYQYLEEYLSPNTPKTELTITGNHPAHLVAYITYQKSTYDPLNEKWNCVAWFANEDHKCCIGGSSVIDVDESDYLWQDDFCCQSSTSGSLDFDGYYCCDETGIGGGYRWVPLNTGSIVSNVASSATTTRAVWYRKIAVRMYAGEQDGCCGVFVEVCLSFRRVLLSDSCGAEYRAVSIDGLCPDPPCGLEACIETSCTKTCTGTCDPAYDPESGGFMNCPSALNAEDYIDPAENPDDDPTWPHYSILRRKFISGSPSCTARDLPVLNVTLTPDDDVPYDAIGTNLGVCDYCPTDQELPGGIHYDFCVPDRVYYDRGEYADASEACCPEEPTVTCGGVAKTPGFAALNGYCWTRCDDVVVYGIFTSGGVAMECSGDLYCDIGDVFHNCWAYQEVVQELGIVYEVRNRSNTIDDQCSIDVCGYLLFGELDDTWNLSITLPS